ncbi:MAG: hypothetical protein AB8B48_00910, partial [Pseudomonadales bacterium]
MAVTSQLAVADAANDPTFESVSVSAQNTNAQMSEELDQGWGEAIRHPDLADYSSDIEQELQDKLDNSLQFDMPPRNPTDPEFAGTQ